MSDPCQNGGTCTDIIAGSYMCQCVSGLEGVLCEKGSYDNYFLVLPLKPTLARTDRRSMGDKLVNKIEEEFG